MTNEARDDALRDKHLLAALRHAPDRNVAPPAAVSAAILQQAQAAARGSAVHVAEPTARAAPSSAQHGGWWLGLKDGLNKLLRPAPAAAFGTLAVAGIVGLLWSTQEPPGVVDETPIVAVPTAALPAPAASVARDDKLSAMRAPAPLPEAQLTQQATPAPADAPPAPTAKPPAKPAPRARAADTPAATGPASPKAAPPAAKAAVTKQSTPAPAIATEATLPAPPSPPAAAAVGAPPPAAPAPTSVQSTPAAAARSGAMAGARQANDVAAFKAPASESAEAAAAPRKRRVSAAPSPSPSPSLSPMALSLARSPLPLGSLGAATAAQWTLPAGRSIAHGPLQQQWLGDIQRNAGTWQRADGPMPTASAPLFVVRDGESAVGSLWMEGTTLWWRDARGQLFTAQAREDQVRGWIEAAKNW